jgi:hypothetical protein
MAVLLAIIIIQRGCTKDCPDCPETSYTEIWHYDSIPVVSRIPVPYPLRVLVPVQVPVVVDTAGILKDYFKRNVYHRILKDDSAALISLEDTVSCNKLLSSTLTYTNRRPTKVEHITTLLPGPVNKVFIGLAIGGSVKGNQTFGASALLVTKNDNAYGLIMDPFAKGVTFSALWKISLKKRNKKNGHANN